MLERFNSCLRIGVARSGLALLQSSAWRPRITPLSDTSFATEEGTSVERMANHLRSMLAEAACTHRAARVVLADDWVRLFMVEPPRNTARLQDCRAAAAMRFQALYGESASGWRLEADWDVKHPFLACAVPQPLLTALNQTAAEHRLTLIEIVPQFIAAWNRWHPLIKPDAWFGVAHAGMLTLGVIQERRLCAVRAVAVPAGGWQDRQWLAAHLSREAMRLDLPVASHVQLCGAVPDAWIGPIAGPFMCDRLGSGQCDQSLALALASTGSCA
jgi:hypothetical protein